VRRTERALTLTALGTLMVALFLGAAGQLLMKSGMSQFQEHHGEVENYLTVLRAMLQAACIAGLACYFVSSVIYLKLVAAMPLSLLYPMVAMNYVIVTVLSWLIFHEQVPPLRIVGLATIICGVALVGLSEPDPAAQAPAVGGSASGAEAPAAQP